jgi:hypothetical protein
VRKFVAQLRAYCKRNCGYRELVMRLVTAWALSRQLSKILEHGTLQSFIMEHDQIGD